MAADNVATARLPAITGLATLNPYVGSILGGGAPSKRPMSAPRTTRGLATARGRLAAGTSSFGMSGVNAHAVLVATTDVCCTDDDGMFLIKGLQASGQSVASTKLLTTSWPIPLLSSLIATISRANRDAIEFVLGLGHANLAWLREHAVAGLGPLLPATASVEACLAAAGVAPMASSNAVSVQQLAFVSPCQLRGAAQATVTLHLGSGRVSLGTPVLHRGSSVHAAGLVATVSHDKRAGASGGVQTARDEAMLLPCLRAACAAALPALRGGAPRGLHLARITSPSSDAASSQLLFDVHPAKADASLHLSALGLGGELHVPASAAVCLGRRRAEGGAGKFEDSFAVAEVTGRGNLC